MKVFQEGVSREGVIRFYAAYDRRKKGQPSLTGLTAWPWLDPDGLDRKLHENGLKKGVLAAYRTWILAQLEISDILECAVDNSIFPREPQALGQLLLRGKLAEWIPTGSPEWWPSIGNGLELNAESALILRPAVQSEAPAKWYVEDGSGRALALLQWILRYVETSRTAWAYIGDVPDESSFFIKSHPELKSWRANLGRPAA